MAGKNMSILYSLLVLSSCILQGYSLPQRRMSAEEFGRKFGSGPNEISNEIDFKEEVGNPVAKEEGGLTKTIIDIALQVLPLVVNALTDGTGPSQTDRIEEVSLNGEDPFSVKNILVLGLKLFLAVAGNTSDVDRNDTDNSPLRAALQSVMQAVITAATGSKDREEVATMAEQATQVIDLVISLVEALTTSISQRRSYY